MSRRCDCARLLERLQTDPQLLVLPLAVTGLLVRLAAHAARMAVPGVFRLGGNPMGFDQVSRLVSAGETEVENLIGNLLETGWLVRDAADGALVMPAMTLGDEAEAGRKSRENGRLGGRPRRGETAREARERRQGNLMLPIDGGGAGNLAETQPETLAGARLASQPASSLSQGEEASQQQSRAIGDAELRSIGDELAAIAGFDPARDAYSLHDVRAWLAAGATRELLVDVIGQVAGRASYTKPSRYWRYFDPAVRQALAERRPAAVDDPEWARLKAEWERQRTEWENNGRVGPAPPVPMRRAA